jgi:protein-L-isoaspartate(D-aspartate) O-methyltransferase
VSQTASTVSSNQPDEATGGIGHDQADELRAALVRELRDEGVIVSEPVAEAFAAVPRHLFAPGESLEAAYAPHGTVMPKRDADGLLLSVLSAPNIQAMMLEPAGVEPGMRVLEIGSGGVNAALIAELAGPGGKVTTMDIDPDVTARTRACLDAAGYGQVRVVLADAEDGVPAGAPYDRIIVTAGSWDVPPAWVSQLAPGGRLVVPLRLRGLTRTVTFEPDSGGLVSRHYQLAAFVPFQGDGAHADRKVTLREGVVVHTDDPALLIDAAALNAALDGPRVEVWTGAKYDFPDEVSLFTTLNSPQVAQLRASQQAIDAGIVSRGALYGIPAMITADSIAYRMTRQVSDDPAEYESGVVAHGPHAESVAAQYADLLRRWARDYCSRGTALFRYLPGDSAPDPLPLGAVVKRHGAVTVTWP